MARPKRRRERVQVQAEAPERDWLPMSSFLGIMAGFLGAYLIAEAAFFARPHPVHWAVAAAGGGLGYVAGLVWDWVYAR